MAMCRCGAETRRRKPTGLVAHGERHVGNANRRFLQQRACTLETQPRQPLVRGASRGMTEGRAKVGSAEGGEIRKLVETDVSIQPFGHVGSDLTDLPLRKPALRQRQGHLAERRVGAKEVRAQKIESLLDEETRGRLGMNGLMGQYAQDVSPHRIGLGNARDSSTREPRVSGAAKGLQTRVAQKDIGEGRLASMLQWPHHPAGMMPTPPSRPVPERTLRSQRHERGAGFP